MVDKVYLAPALFNGLIILIETSMKKYILGLSVLSVFLPTLAQQPLPTNIVPLNGEVILRLTPKHVARCTTKKNEAKPGEFFGTRSTYFGTQEIFEESLGNPKLSFVVGDAMNYFRIVAEVKPDGSGLMPTTPEIQTNMQATTEKDRQEFEAVKQILVQMPKLGSFAIGVPLRQGSAVSLGDTCQLFPGSSGTERRSGEYRVLGVTAVMGRESIVLGGEESVSCILPGTSLNMHVKGWWAIDQQSGVTTASSTISKASVTGKSGEATTSEDRECVVTGGFSRSDKGQSPGLGNMSTPGASEQRLLALKLLLDKGLITKEQYEQKSTEILKTL